MSHSSVLVESSLRYIATRKYIDMLFVEIFRMDELIVQNVSGTNSIYSTEIRCFGIRSDWDVLGVKF